MKKLDRTGEPTLEDATEEKELAKQHAREMECREYASIMHIISVGAYTESSEDGSYWFEDQNISARLQTMDLWALAQGWHFVPQGEVYVLEPATHDELVSYQLALEAEESEEEQP